MIVLVVAVGSVRGLHEAAAREYVVRAARYWKLELLEVEAGAHQGSASASPEQVRDAEGKRILARVPNDLELVALTRRGTSWTSREFASYLGQFALRSRRGVAIAVGGAFGLSQDVLTRASQRLALSALTLPHEMARIVVLEQLYRAGTILRGEPYHKESQ